MPSVEPEAVLETVAVAAVAGEPPEPAARAAVPETDIQEVAPRRTDRVGRGAGVAPARPATVDAVPVAHPVLGEEVALRPVLQVAGAGVGPVEGPERLTLAGQAVMETTAIAAKGARVVVLPVAARVDDQVEPRVPRAGKVHAVAAVGPPAGGEPGRPVRVGLAAEAREAKEAADPAVPVPAGGA